VLFAVRNRVIQVTITNESRLSQQTAISALAS
jgi:hypothetical protein